MKRPKVPVVHTEQRSGKQKAYDQMKIGVASGVSMKDMPDYLSIGVSYGDFSKEDADWVLRSQK